MKILAVSNLYPPFFRGGYELMCAQAVKGLRQNGHEVIVLTSTYGGVSAPGDEQVHRRLRIHGMYGFPWLGILKLGELEFENNRILDEMLKTHRPDLVFVWNLGGVSKSLLFQLQRQRIPTAFYVSDHWIARAVRADVWTYWWNRDQPTTVQKWIRSFLAFTGIQARWDLVASTEPLRNLRFPRLAFCSKALREFTAKAGFPVANGEIIHCPVNISHFTGEPRIETSPMRKLLYVGRLTEDKGVMTALQAMTHLKDRFVGSMTLVGKGEEAYVKSLKDYANSNRLPVTFSEVSDPEKMPEVYRAHDALVFPSEWEEPFAITPLEAMASGLPVIATLTGGSPELFRHGENALTYVAGRAEELAARILQLDQNPGMRLRLAAVGQAEVRSRFSEIAFLEKIEQFLKDSLSSWPPPTV